MKAASLFLAAGLLLSGDSFPAPGSLPQVVPNDNRIPAGRLRGDTLLLDLEVRMATWYPEADSGPGVEVAAFAEVGKAPSIPAPLIRVAQGTVILARIRNLLPDSTLSLHGLLSRPAATKDSIVLRPGDSATVRFTAGVPGTYLYHAVLGVHNNDAKDDEREQLAGALIVDPRDGSLPDRVFVINIWGSQIDSATYSNAVAINGRSWPWTERISAQVGDTLRWRVINASVRGHPMHLHGFYFRLESRGNALADSVFSGDARRLQVTESMRPLATMSMAWSPDRAGNWLFHCHIGFHVLPSARVNPPAWDHPDYASHDPARHMAGLILGIEVKARPGQVDEDRRGAERLRLFVQEGPKRTHARRALGFVLQRGQHAPAPDSVVLPSSTLLLTRGRPADITVVNRLKETSVIHWHGIELESYSDGVAGWSGSGDRLAPSIQPGDSFVARLTLPRAGTFMYHTHLNDIDQLTSGLYGGIIVVDPDKPYDPTRDHLFVAGWDGEGGDSTGPRTLVNGDSMPLPLELKAGVTHRFRFVNIGPAGRMNFRIFQDSSLVSWRVVALDGADLPASQIRSTPARRAFDVGETFDTEIEFTPGEYRLVAARNPRFPFYVRRLIVR